MISVKLSKSGSPLVVLATRHAFLFDTSLMCWLRVADDCFPASNFSSSWNLGSAPCGELAGLQVDVRKYMARKPGWNRSVLSSFSLMSALRPITYSESIRKAYFMLIGLLMMECKHVHIWNLNLHPLLRWSLLTNTASASSPM